MKGICWGFHWSYVVNAQRFKCVKTVLERAQQLNTRVTNARPPVMDDDYDEDSLLGALRSISASGIRGATFNPMASLQAGRPGPDAPFDEDAPFGEDNANVLLRARSAMSHYEKLKITHQINLHDPKQLADLEDPGLQAHMELARKKMADYERNQATLPSKEAMQRSNIEANRALSSLMTSLKNQQMAMQIVSDNILLQAMNAQKLAEGGQPHGYPAENSSPPQVIAAKSFELLGKKILATGNDISQIFTALEGIERDLSFARRASESAFDGLARRGRYFEDAYFEVAYGEERCPPTAR